LIAQHPAERRESSRLLVLERSSGKLLHQVFTDLTDLIPAGDLVVLNETRVFPARLRGTRAGGGSGEVLLLHPVPDGDDVWLALVRPGARLRTGRWLQIASDLQVEITGETPEGERLVKLHSVLPTPTAIERYGQIPLPPYIRRTPVADDRERYQTVYATTSGSVAAPTAGLHFTPELLARLAEGGVRFARLVLHVGVGTFRPVEVEDPADHRMHREWYDVPEAAATEINRVRADGGSIWAVGTTTVRTLESIADSSGRVHSGSGWTDIFIRPPYPFRAVDRLITNFHLPRSTLLMLVAAFAGHDCTIAAYREAIAARYRFYSYGDAMAVV
jgi:S-adenosylmethionine:tRNA ribosyltransferase-isomerase